MLIFDKYNTTSKASAAVKDATPSYAATNLAYLSGDHWQKATAWIGPPVPTDMADYDQVLNGINRDFTPVPLIEDSIERHVTGVLSREVAFHLTPISEPSEDEPEAETKARQTKINRLDALSGAWWDSRSAHEVFADEWLPRLLSCNRAPLRLRLVSDESGNRPAPQTLEEALGLLYFEVPELEAATVSTERDTMQKAGLYLYSEAEKQGEGSEAVTKTFLEINFVSDGTEEVTGAIFPDSPTGGIVPAGYTVFRVIKEDEVESDFAIDLGGELFLFEATHKPLITEPVRRLQNAVNMLNSMLPRNGKYAGHRGRHTINLKAPLDENDKETDPVTGAGILNMWQVTTYIDANGAEKAMPAQLVFEEPVDSAPIRADIDHMAEKILEAFNQSHIQINGDGGASAVALVQKRAAFAQALLKTKPKVEGAVRWLIKTVLYAAAALAGEKETLAFLKTVRVDAECKPNSGPLSPDEMRVVVELYEKGLLNDELAMVLLGIEDIDSVKAKLDNDPVRLIERRLKQVQLFDALSQSLSVQQAFAAAIPADSWLELAEAIAGAQPVGG